MIQRLFIFFSSPCYPLGNRENAKNSCHCVGSNVTLISAYARFPSFTACTDLWPLPHLENTVNKSSSLLFNISYSYCLYPTDWLLNILSFMVTDSTKISSNHKKSWASQQLKTSSSKLFSEVIIMIKYNQVHITHLYLVLLGDLAQVAIVWSIQPLQR